MTRFLSSTLLSFPSIPRTLPLVLPANYRPGFKQTSTLPAISHSNCTRALNSHSSHTCTATKSSSTNYSQLPDFAPHSYPATRSGPLPLHTRVYPSSTLTNVTLAHRALPRLQALQRHLGDSGSHNFSTSSNPQRPALYHPQVVKAVDTSTFVKNKTYAATVPQIQKSVRMSTQPEHAALMIPGPIEFDDAVLGAMSHYSESHVGAAFVGVFGETLTMLRKVFQSTDPASQPFIISGSGTLGWDQVAANLAEPGDDVLVLHTGYFADSFADCFETYGVKATQLKAEIGDRPQLDEVEKALKEKKYKLLTVTHVDTSTGVLSEIKALSELVQRVSPETLLIVDGVCSAGSEEIRFDDWKIDVVITASQKALGCPAGLSIVYASGKAIERFKSRKTRPTSYFGSWANWLPIMQNYEAKKPSYFATPSPQLVRALHTSLTQITSRTMDQRFADHRAASKKVKEGIARLGLKQLASKPENQANGMTAIYLPEGMTPPDVLPKLMKKGVVFAGGLHKQIATKYIRFGHMGVSVTDPKRDDIERSIKALEEGLVEAGYKVPNGAA